MANTSAYLTLNHRLLCGKIAEFLSKPSHSKQNCPDTRANCLLTPQNMVALKTLLNAYREAAQTHREKGTYFDILIYFVF
jgi:hypothetical protein